MEDRRIYLLKGIQDLLRIQIYILNEVYDMKCPVCGNDTFDDKDYEFDICPKCFWEYDILQVDEPDYQGGTNCHSLNEYKKTYWIILK